MTAFPRITSKFKCSAALGVSVHGGSQWGCYLHVVSSQSVTSEILRKSIRNTPNVSVRSSRSKIINPNPLADRGVPGLRPLQSL